MKIVFFGDSITDMGRSRNYSDSLPFKSGVGYVFNVCTTLMSKKPFGYEFVNAGISGNRILDLNARYKEDVIAHKPDLLSILIGVNDVWHGIFDKSKKVPQKLFYNMYKDMLIDIKKELPNIKIMLLEPFYTDGSATHDYDFSKVYKMAKIVKKIAKEFGCTFVPLQKKFDKAIGNQSSEPWLFDGVHPNLLGAKLIADEWIKAFNKLNK